MQSRLIAFVIIVILAIPVYFFLKILERRKRAKLLKKNGVYANAIVMQVTTLDNTRGTPTDLLLMEYQDRATGQPYSTQIYVKHRRYKNGDNFPIVYNPSNPAMYVPDEKKAYVLYLILITLIFVAMVIAAYIIKDNMREKHEEPILKVNGTPKL